MLQVITSYLWENSSVIFGLFFSSFRYANFELINRAFKEDATKEKAVGLPKWNKIRKIIIPQSATDCLGRRGKDSDFVFSEIKDRAISANKFSKKFSLYIAYVDRASIEETGYSFSNGIHYTPHCLRGTLNSALVNSYTLNNALIQNYMGWTKSELSAVQREHYTKFDDKSLWEVANRIEILFSGNPMEWKIGNITTTSNLKSLKAAIKKGKGNYSGAISLLNKDNGLDGKYDDVDKATGTEIVRVVD